MTPSTRAVIDRTWFGLTALVILVALVVQTQVTIDKTDGLFGTAQGRVFNQFCYFTIQSNLIVGVTCALLAIRLSRSSTVFAVFRLVGVVGITITFVVFHVALSGLQDLEGSAKLADFLLHTLAPLMAVAGWLVLGPRGLAPRRVALWSLLYPIGWLVFTLIRGPIVDYYPYPFLDVADHGYLRVAANCVVVALAFGVVTLCAHLIDPRIPPNGSHPAEISEHAG